MEAGKSVVSFALQVKHEVGLEFHSVVAALRGEKVGRFGICLRSGANNTVFMSSVYGDKRRTRTKTTGIWVSATLCGWLFIYGVGKLKVAVDYSFKF